MYQRHDPSRSTPLLCLVSATLLLVLAACRGDSSGPGERTLTLRTGAGTPQFGTPGNPLDEPFAVIVTEAGSGRIAADIQVRWSIAQGGGFLSSATSTTDAKGIARTTLRLGPDTGAVRVEADVDHRTGPVASFHARAVRTPAITSVTPLPIEAGGAITIEGENFSTRADDHIVLFAGRRGRVSAATPTQLTVEVPACLPDGSHAVRVRLGAVFSNAFNAETEGATPAPLALAPGQFQLLAGDDLACLAFPATPGTSWLVAPINADRLPGVEMGFELAGLGGSITATTGRQHATTADASLRWEAQLRAWERAIAPGPLALSPDAAQARVAVELGERTRFNVLNSSGGTQPITAEVRAIGEHAIVYVDLESPAGGFSQTELDVFARIFDDPIFPLGSEVFGAPSDVDANGRIIILLTPRVNALTSRNDDSFIAGFFYGCDLVEQNRCSDTNHAEIFYSMVPDPTGQFGGARSRQTVLSTVPGVLAHEFQHMISFGRKGRLDLLWLSEGLAHMAEELVGRAFLERGDAEAADDYRRPNFTRARNYLFHPPATSLLDEESPGTLELRGGAWLFVQYLAEQYGGATVLHRLTGAAQIGAANVEAQTGRAWEDVLGEWSLALWAAAAPEFHDVDLPQRLTYGNFQLREEISGMNNFPLQPQTLPFETFTWFGELLPGTFDHFLFDSANATGPPFTLSLAGRYGGSFFSGTPRMAVLRVR